MLLHCLPMSARASSCCVSSALSCHVQGSTKEALAPASPGFTLRFQPPLTFFNCLPHAISLSLFDSAGGADATTFSVPVGGSYAVYHFDLSRRIYMSMTMMVCLVQSHFNASGIRIESISHRHCMLCTLEGALTGHACSLHKPLHRSTARCAL